MVKTGPVISPDTVDGNPKHRSESDSGEGPQSDVVTSGGRFRIQPCSFSTSPETPQANQHQKTRCNPPPEGGGGAWL